MCEQEERCGTGDNEVRDAVAGAVDAYEVNGARADYLARSGSASQTSSSLPHHPAISSAPGRDDGSGTMTAPRRASSIGTRRDFCLRSKPQQRTGAVGVSPVMFGVHLEVRKMRFSVAEFGGSLGARDHDYFWGLSRRATSDRASPPAPTRSVVLTMSIHSLWFLGEVNFQSSGMRR